MHTTLRVCSIERPNPCSDSPGLPYEPSSLLGASAQHVSVAAAPLPKGSLTIRPLPPWLARLVPMRPRRVSGRGSMPRPPPVSGSSTRTVAWIYSPRVVALRAPKSGVGYSAREAPTQLLLWAMAQATISQHEILTRVLAHSSLIFSDADA